MKAILPVLIGLFVGSQALAQAAAKGYVFDDAHKNGKNESTEKGIAGVSVTNGLNAVQTDNKGNYELPVGKGSEPMGKLPESVNLALIPYNDPTTLTSLFFGGRRPSNGVESIQKQSFNVEEPA